MSTVTTKVALITGANKGIGLETAKQLGKLGITVLVGARDLAKGEEAAEVLRGIGVDARAIKLDVVNEADRAAAAKFIEKEFGRLDILINNAGVMLDAEIGKRDEHHTFEGPARDVRNEFLCGGSADPDPAPADPAKARPAAS